MTRPSIIDTPASRLIDLAGATFGHWLVLRRAENRGRVTRWVCRCACGVERAVIATSLRDGLSTSCGCGGIAGRKPRDARYGRPTWEVRQDGSFIYCGILCARADDGAVGIPTASGELAWVDQDVFPLVAQRYWSAHHGRRDRHTIYAVTGKPRIWMHRLVLAAPADLQIDHDDRDGLNNRKSNLRFATPLQNIANRDMPKGKFGYRGVHKSRNRFFARVGDGYKRKHLGGFATAEEAARAYDAYAFALHGPFAVLNFPAQDASNE